MEDLHFRKLQRGIKARQLGHTIHNVSKEELSLSVPCLVNKRGSTPAFCEMTAQDQKLALFEWPFLCVDVSQERLFLLWMSVPRCHAPVTKISQDDPTDLILFLQEMMKNSSSVCSAKLWKSSVSVAVCVQRKNACNFWCPYL